MRPKAEDMSWKDWKAIQELSRVEYWYLKTKGLYFLWECDSDWLKRAF